MAPKRMVGVGDMAISTEDEILVTHGLGSCLGVAIHDARSGVAGLLHVMLPTASLDPEKARAKPLMFVDTGLPAFFRAAYEAGAEKRRLRVAIAGGAITTAAGLDRFEIGRRNYVMLRRMLWKNGIMVDAEQVGGDLPRTMYVETATGRVWLNSNGDTVELLGGA